MRHRRIVSTALPAVIALFILSCAGQPRVGSLPSRVALTYGVADFDQIDALRYRFNATVAGKEVRRSWEWYPESDQVVFFGTAEQGGTLRYNRSQLGRSTSDTLRRVDGWFINDQYWLLFPLHLAWDRMATISENSGMHQLPIGDGSARRLVVKYPSTGGYTPGDVYELFVGADGRIRQLIYRRGGSPEPTRVSTWEDHRRFGPLLIALDHRGTDETFRVWFSDVAVKLKGKSGWTTEK